MNFTRIKTTMMAGVLAASMLMPGMTAVAAVTNGNQTGTISKTVKAAAEGVTVNQEFTFKFAQRTTETTDSGVTANEVTASIPDIKVTATSVNTATLSTTAIDLSNCNKAGVYTYTVTEEDKSADLTTDTVKWTFDTTSYKLRVYVKDEEGTLTKTITLVKLDADGNETGDKLENAAFENVLKKTSTEKDNALFSLSKTVADDSSIEPQGQKYKFTVTITPDTVNGTPEGGYTYVVGGTTYTLGSDPVELESGETAYFTNISAGDKVTVVEVNNPANVKQVDITTVENGGTPSTTTNSSDKTVSGLLVGENGSSASYTNTWNTTTETGVVTSIAPYVTLVVLAVAAVAGYMAMKSRVAR